MQDHSSKTIYKRSYITPTTENILGYITEELFRQMTGPTSSESASFGLPDLWTRAQAIVHGNQPLMIYKATEIIEPQGVHFVDNYVKQGF